MNQLCHGQDRYVNLSGIKRLISRTGIFNICRDIAGHHQLAPGVSIPGSTALGLMSLMCNLYLKASLQRDALVLNDLYLYSVQAVFWQESPK